MLDVMTHLFRLRTVVEAGSMRQAAEVLNVTQPALSRSIAQLEARFGQPLLVRHSRGIVPTAFGARVRVARSAAAGPALGTGRSRICRDRRCGRPGTHSAAGRAALACRGAAGTDRRAATGRCPRLTVEMQNAADRNLAGRSGRGPLRRDLRRAADSSTASTCGVDRATSPPFTTASSPARITRSSRPSTPASASTPRVLLDFPWLVYAADPVYELQTLHATVERLGRAPDIRATCESLIGALAILQHSDFLCILPDAAVADTRSPRIVPLPVELGRRQVPSGAIYRDEMYEWEPLRKLLELCEGYFAVA